MPVNILLADDHTIVTAGLKLLINRLLPEAQVTTVRDFDDALTFLHHTKAQLVVCDINMPGANHFSIVKKIKLVQPDTKLLLLTAYDARLYAQRYLEEGADVYMNKGAEISLFAEAALRLLHGAAQKSIITGEGQKSKDTQKTLSQLKQLSNRELEVAQLLVNGQSIIEIAHLLEVAASTVSTYRMRIFEKLKVSSVHGLMTIFHNVAGLHPDNR